MKKMIKFFLMGLFVFTLTKTQPNYAAEPNMIDYTSLPLLMLKSEKPNILIMLDNSGSMNFNAYGSWPGDNNIVQNDSFVGLPYQDMDFYVTSGSDDAEERNPDTHTYHAYHDSGDLDLGRDIDTNFSDMAIGTRFNNIKIPRGATISRAYIEFTTYSIYASTQNTIQLSIHGEDVDNSATFTATSKNITARPTTAASLTWDVDPWVALYEKHQTPDIKTIIQEIIDRPAWAEGNSLTFIFNTIGGSPGSGRPAYSRNGDSAKAPLLHIEIENVDSAEYYGLFNPKYFYLYGTNKFNHAYKKINYEGDPAAGGYWKVYALDQLDSAGNPLAGAAVTSLADADITANNLWDGNWLNWVSMRRLDILRKVLMGGPVETRTGGGNEITVGENPSGRKFIKHFDSSSMSAVSPYDGDYHYGMADGRIYVDDDSTPFSGAIAYYTLAVQKEIRFDPDSFYKYEITSGTKDYSTAGVLQRVGDSARWGNEFFYNGSGSGAQGGYIDNPVGTNMTSLITDLQNKPANTWTPLAEAYYVAMQYFKQEAPETGLGYNTDAIGDMDPVNDPLYDGDVGDYVYCAKNFVLLLTDGASTKDSKVPDFLKDYDVDGDKPACDEADNNPPCDYGSGGTDYLDDIALYARTTDLRSDIVDVQNLLLYTVYAFGDDPDARNLLMDAARNGGFEDMNGNNRPDGDYTDPPEDRLEWDRDGDGRPDTYFEATDGKKLEAELLKAINAMLNRATSGTAVSVLSTSSRGAGNLLQAYFKPMVATGTEEARWVGYLQSHWLDEKGNLREDTDQDHKLDTSIDKIIKFFPAADETLVKVFDVSAADPFPDLDTAPNILKSMDNINPVWDAGKLLAARSPDNRKIFTFIDKDNDGTVDESTDDPFDAAGEVIRFQTDVATLKPYLGLLDDTWLYLGNTDNRFSNLVKFIRGYDTGFSGDTEIRTRNINGEVWKLGDIIYSTPMILSGPPDNYDLLYADESYRTFFEAFKDRETMAYVGANDGMIHAFTSWVFNSETIEYTQKPGTSENIGDELWAYIPQTLLPHLKWLADKDYGHVYYADLKPKIFDAKILRNGTHYTDPDFDDNWGTFMLIGLNRGGKHIWSQGDFDNNPLTADTVKHFYPSYTCLDITDPRNPRLLWEKTYAKPGSPFENADNDTDLGLTTSYPSIARVGEKWFAIFGSGPADYDGISDRKGHVFVVDLKTGEPYQNGTNDWLFEGINDRATMASPVSLDKNMNYNVDAAYIGESYDSDAGAGETWEGTMYKITIPWTAPGLCDYGYGPTDCIYGDMDNGSYSDNPNDPVNPWFMSTLFEAPGPITAPASLSVDEKENAWVFFGTGRYFSDSDAANNDQQSFYGIKDPFFNKEHDTFANCAPLGGCAFGDGYYHNYASSLPLDTTDLFDANPYTIVSVGEVYTGIPGNYTYFGDFSDLIDAAEQKNGWHKDLYLAGERNITKPAIAGGIVFASTFKPANALCEPGGESFLYSFYYKTGTPYMKSVFTGTGESIVIDSETKEKVVGIIDLGEGLASGPTIHLGDQAPKKGTVFVQKSTSEITGFEVDLANTPRSTLKSWIDKR